MNEEIFISFGEYQLHGTIYYNRSLSTLSLRKLKIFFSIFKKKTTQTGCSMLNTNKYTPILHSSFEVLTSLFSSSYKYYLYLFSLYEY